MRFENFTASPSDKNPENEALKKEKEREKEAAQRIANLFAIKNDSRDPLSTEGIEVEELDANFNTIEDDVEEVPTTEGLEVGYIRPKGDTGGEERRAA